MATSKTTTSKSTLKEFYSFKEAMRVIHEHELKTVTSFCSKRSRVANFGNTSYDFTKNHKILWGDSLGNELGARKPFIVVNYLVLDCVHGVDKHTKYKEKLKCKREAMRASGQPIGKARKMLQPSKKMDCPAAILMKEVVYFPEYQIPHNSTIFKRTSMSKTLRADIKNNVDVCQERRIIVHFPSLSDHRNHVIGETTGFLQNTDERLKLKIAELVDDLITDTREIKTYLEQYVKDVIFANRTPPEKFNRRYYPTKRDIHNYVALTLKKLRKSNIDEELVKEILLQHGAENPKNLVCFRPSASVATEGEPGSKLSDTLLIVCQTSAQKRLLALYGNDMCLLDATYKAIKYPVPLFLVCVKTNIDYQTVGMIILENELTEHICEGLQILRQSNPTWSPKYFVTNINDQEINAVESIFSGCHVYVCDFHREQEWHRWLAINFNGVSALRVEALTKLLRIAQAQTEDALQIAYDDLEMSDLWKNNSNFQDWFSSEWYPQQERWVQAFRKDEFIFWLHTNNGIECRNEFMKHEHLKKQKRNNTLSSLVATVIHEFFPECYQDYQIANVKFSSAHNLYSEDIPDFLQDRPQPFVVYCMEKMKEAQRFTLNQIEETRSKVFLVRSESKPEHYYYVHFGRETQFPSCECDDWVKTKLLCKHFFAVFANTSNKWDDISELYRNSKYLCLDKHFITSKACKSYSDCSPTVSPTEELTSVIKSLPSSGDLITTLPIHNYSKMGDDASVCREKIETIRITANGINDEKKIQVLNSKLDDIIQWLTRDVSVSPRQKCELLSNITKPNDSNKTTAQKIFESILQNDERETTDDFDVQHSIVLTEMTTAKTNKKRKRCEIAVNILEPECHILSEFGTEPEHTIIIDGEYPVPITETAT